MKTISISMLIKSIFAYTVFICGFVISIVPLHAACICQCIIDGGKISMGTLTQAQAETPCKNECAARVGDLSTPAGVPTVTCRTGQNCLCKCTSTSENVQLSTADQTKAADQCNSECSLLIGKSPNPVLNPKPLICR